MYTSSFFRIKLVESYFLLYYSKVVVSFLSLTKSLSSLMLYFIFTFLLSLLLYSLHFYLYHINFLNLDPKKMLQLPWDEGVYNIPDILLPPFFVNRDISFWHGV